MSRGFRCGPVVRNLPAMQGTPVQSLVWENPACHGQLSPYTATVLKPTALESAPRKEKQPRWGAQTPQLEESPCSYEDPAQSKINKYMSWAKKTSYHWSPLMNQAIFVLFFFSQQKMNLSLLLLVHRSFIINCYAH